jgi:hypothetical protein
MGMTITAAAARPPASHSPSRIAFGHASAGGESGSPSSPGEHRAAKLSRQLAGTATNKPRSDRPTALRAESTSFGAPPVRGSSGSSLCKISNKNRPPSLRRSVQILWLKTNSENRADFQHCSAIGWSGHRAASSAGYYRLPTNRRSCLPRSYGVASAAHAKSRTAGAIRRRLCGVPGKHPPTKGYRRSRPSSTSPYGGSAVN